jgi:hypothetical protein
MATRHLLASATGAVAFLVITMLTSHLQAMQRKGDLGVQSPDAESLLNFSKNQEKLRTDGDMAKYEATLSPDAVFASHQSLLAIQYGRERGLAGLKSEWSSVELKSPPAIENYKTYLLPTGDAQPQFAVLGYDYIFTMPAQQQPERLLFNMVFVKVGGKWQLAFFNETYR